MFNLLLAIALIVGIMFLAGVVALVLIGIYIYFIKDYSVPDDNFFKEFKD